MPEWHAPQPPGTYREAVAAHAVVREHLEERWAEVQRLTGEDYAVALVGYQEEKARLLKEYPAPRGRPPHDLDAPLRPTAPVRASAPADANPEDLGRIVTSVSEFAEIYWSDAGPKGMDRATFRALADEGWRAALKEFLHGYAFERQGASPYFAPAAVAAVDETEYEPDSAELESDIWRRFLDQLGIADDGVGANRQNNPLAPSDQVAISATRLIGELGEHDHNIIRWGSQALLDGEAHRASNRLLRIRGVGAKIAAFFLRDIADAFEIPDEQINRASILQPIDVWTERGAAHLAALLEREPPVDSSESAEVLIDAARSAGVRPTLLNTSLWYLGARVLQGAERFGRALLKGEGLERELAWERAEQQARTEVIERVLGGGQNRLRCDDLPPSRQG